MQQGCRGTEVRWGSRQANAPFVVHHLSSCLYSAALSVPVTESVRFYYCSTLLCTLIAHGILFHAGPCAP